MKNLIFLPALMCALQSMASVYQWSVELPTVVSSETDAPSQAFLWISEDCLEVQAVVVGTHNMSEEPLFEHPLFRKGMAEMGVAIVWITPTLNQEWNESSGCRESFDKMLADLADVSGYGELIDVPIVPIGHSAMATFPWNFAAWNSERTLAIISLHGDAPRTNLCGHGRANLEWGRTRNIDGIPGLMIEGEYEWWEARVNPALAFRMMYPESCVSFLCDGGRGHFDLADRTVEYIALFIKKALQERMPGLKKLDPRNGWLAERWRIDEERHAKPAPFLEYKGDPHDAFWYFDQEMAEWTERIYEQNAKKSKQYVSFTQQGALVDYDSLLHVKAHAKFLPEQDGVTFHLSTAYTDSTRGQFINTHATTPITIVRICGPVRIVNDTTFVIDFYRMGTNNKTRTPMIYLFAESMGDDQYKSAVQELGIAIPYPIKEGKCQVITFPMVKDVKEKTSSIKLDAKSDSGLPVSYYVKEGPAEVEGDVLKFTKIPPRSKMPIKVTVVAWQYGIIGKYQTAEPVEQSFYIIQ